MLECGFTNQGLTAENFRPISERGFGDPYNSYPHSMSWFQDHLYVGTTRGHLFLLGTASRAVPELAPKRLQWPVNVPKNIYHDLDMRAQIWRFNPRDETWKKVYTVPMVKGIDGYDVPLAWGLRGMTVFKSVRDPAPALYIPATAPSQRPEAVLFRTRNGSDFEIVSEPGLGMSNPTPRSLRTVIPFKGRLFTAPAMGQEKGQTCTFGKAAILCTNDPDEANWKVACESGFGNPNNLAVFAMNVFNNHLYAGTTNIQEGFELWKTDGEGDPPFRWTKVLTSGAYRGKFNQIGGIMGAVGEYAIIGTGIQSGGHDRKFKVGPAAPEILRLRYDDTWDVLVGEPRQTPDGLKAPLSGLGPGFDRLRTGYIWYGFFHDGWLYLGTFDWGAFTFFAKVDEMPKQFKNGLEAFQSHLRRAGGYQIWRTADGVSWLPVTRNGFGKYMDLGVRTMRSTPYGLFVGVLNSFGPEMAVRRTGGWTFEHNPDCGLQIYLGRSDHVPSVKGELPWELGRGRSTSAGNGRGRHGGAGEIDTVISECYGGTDFRHVGFWREDIRDLRRACENLVDEILSFMPDKEAAVLDLGCDRGATTQYLAKRLSSGSVTGVVTDKNDLARCEQNAPEVQFHYMNGSGLEFADDSFDYVVSVEGLSRLKKPSAAIQEVYRVLRAGGRFVFSNALVEKEASGVVQRLMKWSGRTPEAPAPADYETQLAAIGFTEISILDVTDNCWKHYQRYLHRYLQALIVRQRISADQARSVAAMLPGGEGPVQKYVLAAARKPEAG